MKNSILCAAVVFVVMLCFSPKLHAQYTDNNGCVDAGPECTDIITGEGGTDSHIGPTDSETGMSSDTCTGNIGVVFCGSALALAIPPPGPLRQQWLVTHFEDMTTPVTQQDIEIVADLYEVDPEALAARVAADPTDSMMGALGNVLGTKKMQDFTGGGGGGGGSSTFISQDGDLVEAETATGGPGGFSVAATALNVASIVLLNPTSMGQDFTGAGMSQDIQGHEYYNGIPTGRTFAAPGDDFKLPQIVPPACAFSKGGC